MKEKPKNLLGSKFSKDKEFQIVVNVTDWNLNSKQYYVSIFQDKVYKFGYMKPHDLHYIWSVLEHVQMDIEQYIDEKERM